MATRYQSAVVAVPLGSGAPGALVVPGAAAWRVHVLSATLAYQGGTIQLFNSGGVALSSPMNADFDLTVIGQWCYTAPGEGLRIATDFVNDCWGTLIWGYVAP